MMSMSQEPTDYFLPHTDLQTLVDVLIQLGFDVIGPTIQQSAIVYRSIQDVESLPKGWTDRQEPALYRNCDFDRRGMAI